MPCEPQYCEQVYIVAVKYFLPAFQPRISSVISVFSGMPVVQHMTKTHEVPGRVAAHNVKVNIRGNKTPAEPQAMQTALFGLYRGSRTLSSSLYTYRYINSELTIICSMMYDTLITGHILEVDSSHF